MNIMKDFNSNKDGKRPSASFVVGAVALLFLSGLFLGLLGEYIGRIYISINDAPQFAVRETVNVENKVEKGR